MPNRRTVLAGAAASLFFADRNRSSAAPFIPPLIKRDYAAERGTFHTHLLKSGPAPDDGDALDAPPTGAEVIQYKSGTLDLLGWRSHPSGQGRKPAVLFLHGGNGMGDGHWDLVQPYLRAGYVAMMPALRAENGQPGAFSGFYDETSDVIAAAHVLAAQPDVDPARLFIAGHSVGGTLTMLAALTSPMFRAASSFSGNPSAYAFFKRFAEDIRFDTSDPREFEMRSAVCYATSFKCPVLIQHGTGEPQTRAISELTAGRARAAGLPVDYGTAPGDHFSAIGEETRRSLAFFAKRGSGIAG